MSSPGRDGIRTIPTSCSGTHVYMVVLAALIGLLGGYGAVGFRLLIQFLQGIFWNTDDFSLAWVESLPWYWVVLVPACGGILVGSIVARFAPEAKGHGVPEVMEAVALHHGRIRPRVVVAKAVASGLCIASGGSVGREGPIVQIGAAIGSTAGQILGVRTRRLRTLVTCGAAAGIAAMFNAPIAGALFAVEVLLGDFGVPQFSPIVISSVVATVVSRHYLGDLPAFEIPEYTLQHPLELVAYVLLGILACFVAISFIRSLYFMEDQFERVMIPLPVKAAIGGAVVGAIAPIYPGVLGVGDEQINVALTGSVVGWTLAGVLAAKLLAVGVTIGSGGSGGIFAPSLFLGAMLGGTIGSLMQFWFPGQVGAPGAYALVGMGAVVAATTHAPITAIVILFELTNDYRIILPLMLSCIIATLMISRLHPESIYTLKLLRRGVRIRGGQEINLLRRIPVSDVLYGEAVTLARGEPLPRIRERFADGRQTFLYVLDKEGRLDGVISTSELFPLAQDADVLKNLTVAQDIAAPDPPSVTTADTLDQVLTKLDLGYRDELPMLDDGRFVGTVRIEDILNRYRAELFRHETAQAFADSMESTRSEQVLRKVGRHAVAELDAPAEFYGRTLAELDMRHKFGINVLLIKSIVEAHAKPEPHVPVPEYRIGPGDRLVVFGLPTQVERLSRS